MRKLRLLLILLLCAVVNGVWAVDVTFTFGNSDRDVSSTTAVTKNTVTVQVTTNGASNAPNFTSDANDVRFQAGNKMTISSSNIITKVVISYTSVDYAKKITQASFNAGTYSYTSGQTTGTWTGSVSSLEIVNRESSQSRISQIVVTYEVAPAYEITAISNNNALGTVALSGSKITGTPAENCHYADPAYTITEGTATVSQNGNEFTVTPSTDCTVRINFEEIPTHTLSYAVSPMGAGSVTLSETSIYEGATATATASANAGYKLTSWSISGTGATLSSTTDNPTTVTMGTADATVTATFEAVTTYEINYSVNGTIINTVNVEENENVDLSAPTSGIPTGYVFKGWVIEANKIDTPTDTDPSANYVTEATSTANITYYAVMAVSESTTNVENKTIKLTNSNFTDALSGSYSTVTITKTIDEVEYKFDMNACKQNSMCQMRDNATISYIHIPVLPGNITSISTSSCTDASNNSFSGTIHIKTAKTRGNADTNDIVKQTFTGASSFNISVTGAHKEAYFLTSAGLRINDLTVNYTVSNTTTTYSNYCTTVPKVVAAYADGWTSYITTANVEFPDNVEAYIVTSIETGIVREQITKAPAGTPLVLHATEGADTYYLLGLAETPEALSTNKLKASDGSITIDDDNYKKIYVLTVVDDTPGFGPLAKGKTLAEGKVYLEFATAQSKDFISFDERSETTGIKAIDNGQWTSDNNAPHYNLAGQKVNESYQGIVIKNGHKYIQK